MKKISFKTFNLGLRLPLIVLVVNWFTNVATGVKNLGLMTIHPTSVCMKSPDCNQRPEFWFSVSLKFLPWIYFVITISTNEKMKSVIPSLAAHYLAIMTSQMVPSTKIFMVLRRTASTAYCISNWIKASIFSLPIIRIGRTVLKDVLLIQSLRFLACFTPWALFSNVYGWSFVFPAYAAVLICGMKVVAEKLMIVRKMHSRHKMLVQAHLLRTLIS